MDPRRCPACRAPWRTVATCPRWWGRPGPGNASGRPRVGAARGGACCLLAGGAMEALAMARAAYALEQTPRARRLLVLALIAGDDAAGARALIAEAGQ